jgi:ATP-dependent DNA ligase
MFFQFIQPCHPQRAETVPAGDDWQHEIKFDGFRVQIHKLGDDVELYSRNGSRFSRRFPRLVEVPRKLPAKSVIIDGEIVASNVTGNAALLAAVPALSEPCGAPRLGVRSPGAQQQGSAEVVA